MAESGRLAAPKAVAPGEFERSRETTWTVSDSSLRVSGFKASPDGLFVTVTVLGHALVVDPVMGFAGPNRSDPDTVGPSIWLAVGRRTILAEIQGGSALHPEHPGDPAVSTYDLWFPFNLEELDDAVHLHVDWPSVLGDRTVRVTNTEISDAAANTLVWPPPPSP